MRLLTLNIRHGGGSRQPKIADFIAAQVADVVVITEYRANESGQALRAAMRESGLAFQEAGTTEARVNSVCIASRLPFTKLRLQPGTEVDAHRVLAVKFDSFALAGAYFPQNEAKRPVFAYLKNTVLPNLGIRGMILGDLNTGRPFEDEAGDTFFCSDCFDELLTAGLVDSWRLRNRAAREFSWYSRAKNGFRIDHALCTPSFDASIGAIQYLHEPRLVGASDHSALVVESDA